MKKISLATILSILFVFSGTLYASTTVLNFTIKPGQKVSSLSYKALNIVCGSALMFASNGVHNVELKKRSTFTVPAATPIIDVGVKCSVWVTDKSGKFIYHLDTNEVTVGPGFANYYFTVNVKQGGANLVFDGTTGN